MTNPEEIIKNSNLLNKHFGYWPSFHDCEIKKIILDSEKDLVNLEIYSFTIENSLKLNGEYKKLNECIIKFILRGIKELSLKDFSDQNVIDEFIIEKHLDGVKMIIESSNGLEGDIKCEIIEIEEIQPLPINL